ncbi:MAG TPA: transcriptional regulator [Desulfofustis sp.]|nr:transcriptional regulator [Desulfofustis sp.]
MAFISSKYNPMEALKGLFTKSTPNETPINPNFDAVRREEEAFATIERGVSEVALEKIVGSVGRYHDFDAHFKPKSFNSDDRVDSIRKEMARGKSFPPISLYQIKDHYYILDGHHRFSAATQLGHTTIKARILELLPSKDTLENRLYLEMVDFKDRYHLSADIILTEPGQYRYLAEQIDEHRAFLSEQSGKPVESAQASADWYRTIYLPLKTIIDNSTLAEAFADRTVDDLYHYISLHQWKFGKSRHYGIGIDRLIPKNMEQFREKMAERSEQEYPEMRREIVAFILINVEGRHETKIMEKLFALDEVREVHSVHGAIDLIVRIRLMRDLLSSDAELLSQFIHGTIRQWNGIISTQTLLPGESMVKQ